MRVRGEEKRRRRGFHPVETRRRRHGPAWRHPKGGTGKRRDGVARLGHSAAMARTRALSRHLSRLRNARPINGDRKSVVYGKSVSVRVDLGGRRIIKKKKKKK